MARNCFVTTFVSFSKKQVFISWIAYCFVLKFLVKTHTFWHCSFERDLYSCVPGMDIAMLECFCAQPVSRIYLQRNPPLSTFPLPKSLLLITTLCLKQHLGIISQQVAGKIICTHMLLECHVTNKTLHIIRFYFLKLYHGLSKEKQTLDEFSLQLFSLFRN